MPRLILQNSELEREKVALETACVLWLIKEAEFLDRENSVKQMEINLQ